MMDGNILDTTPMQVGAGALDEQQLFSFVEYSSEAAEETAYSEYSYWKSVWRNFLKRRVAVVMSCVFIVLFLFTFIAGPIGNYRYSELKTDKTQIFVKPNSHYWFGTDNLGRDYWAQVWYATQTSIKLATLVAVGEIALGVIIGLIWGYQRKLDRFFTELYSILVNVPRIIYLTLIALLIGQSFFVLTSALILFGWMAPARHVRNLVLMYRDREYNLASRCLGTPMGRILTRNILPYLTSAIILRLALSIPATIAIETTLSYLGLGLGVEKPSLGILLRNARTYFLDYPHLLLFPAVIVSLITITFYLVGNAFSDACDPRNHV
ncbi:MAG: oligopeptide ABC transporter permease OppC [Bacillota bacterium]|jgi:oligopeptide transport system permease protein